MRRPGASPLGAFPPQTLGTVFDVLCLIWAVDHALQRTSKRMDKTLGITAPQRLVIRIVGRYPGIPAGHVARLLSVHPGTLSGILKRLERQGLLRRHSDPRDGRRSLLGLTDRGRRLDVATEGTIEAAIRRVLERTDDRRIRAACDVLGSIVEALQVAEGQQHHRHA